VSPGAGGGPTVLTGTSGFSYPAWRGPFYPADLPAKAMLAFYAGRLGTVEINNTFYRLPTAALLAGWAAETPAGFRFALKAPQRITHQRRLREAGELAAHFCELAATLGPRRGPLLFQLPPNLRADVPRLTDFLAALPAGHRVAFEFRHASWFADAAYAALRAHGAALCIADAAELSTPFETTAPFGYLRLRREDYDAGALADWAARVRAARWERAYVYFKHEDAGRGPALAAAFAGLATAG
jgi:uncharacterized protein YecE (DUF72 family)